MDWLLLCRNADTHLPAAQRHDTPLILSGIAAFESIAQIGHTCTCSVVLRMEPRPVSRNGSGAQAVLGTSHYLDRPQRCLFPVQLEIWERVSGTQVHRNYLCNKRRLDRYPVGRLVARVAGALVWLESVVPRLGELP